MTRLHLTYFTRMRCLGVWYILQHAPALSTGSPSGLQPWYFMGATCVLCYRLAPVFAHRQPISTHKGSCNQGFRSSVISMITGCDLYSTVGLDRKNWLCDRQRTREEESLIHGGLLCKPDVTEVLLAFAYSSDIAALPKDLHDKLLVGVLWETPNEDRFTSWRTFSRGRRGKVWRKQKKSKAGSYCTCVLI